MSRVESLQIWEGHDVTVTFADGACVDLNLDPFLHGPHFDELRDHPELFRQARVDHKVGAIVWPNGANILFDDLYHGHAAATGR